jgi:hypothetical protein
MAERKRYDAAKGLSQYEAKRARKTRDLCQTDWQDANPGQYAPDTIRQGTCAKCGEDTLVYRSWLANEQEAIDREGKRQADVINMDLALQAAFDELTTLETVFEANGGRGVEDAERIDELRKQLTDAGVEMWA